MAKDWAKPFYNSKRWQSFRRSYISRRLNIDGGLCEICKEEPGEELDHIIELTEDNIRDPSITLNDNNMQWLCHTCHTRKTKGIKRIMFGKDGQPILTD